MALPTPEPGLVICYSYLWHDQQRSGESEGRKNRPCAIILAVKDDTGDIRTYVAPITHVRPSDPHAIELPPFVKRKLGMDETPSWVICNELNWFIWPGFDLQPIARETPDSFAWGFLPVEIFEAVKRGILAHREAGKLKTTQRDE